MAIGREDLAALAAYRTIHPAGPPYSGLPDNERQRWREAYGVARRINPTIIKLAPSLELTQTSFDYARTLLGGIPPHMVTVYAGPYYADICRRLTDGAGCKCVELPQDIFVTRYAWALDSGDGCVLSMPQD